MRVQVYYNRTRRIWSIRKSGKVVRHDSELALRDCRMSVSEKARIRTVTTGRRGVHAWISGELLDAVPRQPGLVEISYNPFKAGYFLTRAESMPVHAAPLVIFTAAGKCQAHISLNRN
jgi:hypothetical protein